MAFSYSDQLRANLMTKQYFLEIDLGHLISFDEELANRLTNNPTDLLPLASICCNCNARISTPLTPYTLF
jgi:DNA replication licensing factor MCM5